MSSHQYGFTQDLFSIGGGGGLQNAHALLATEIRMQKSLEQNYRHPLNEPMILT